MLWALYQSAGWLYTATWTTKKVLVDSTWSLGSSSLMYSGQLFLLVAVAASVGYTALLPAYQGIGGEYYR